MGKIIKYLLGGFVALFVISLFIDDEKEAAEAPAALVDGNGPLETGRAQEESEKAVKDGEKRSASNPNWGDGTVHKVNGHEYKREVLDPTKPNAKYLGEGPCVVDFYASWCGPCKALAPELEKMAERFKGKVRFYKVDVDMNGDLASAYGIQSIPTLVFFDKNGKSEVRIGIPYDLESIVEQLAE